MPGPVAENHRSHLELDLLMGLLFDVFSILMHFQSFVRLLPLQNIAYNQLNTVKGKMYYNRLVLEF